MSFRLATTFVASRISWAAVTVLSSGTDHTLDGVVRVPSEGFDGCDGVVVIVFAVYKQGGVCTIIVNGAGLKLHIPRRRVLKIQVEDDDVQLEVMSHFDHVVERGRSLPLHYLLEIARRIFLHHDLSLFRSSLAHGVILLAQVVHHSFALTTGLGILPHFVSLGNRHGTVEAKLVVGIVNPDDSLHLP